MWLSHELLMEMEVATSYCFVGGNNTQTGAIVGDSEANFFPIILQMVVLWHHHLCI